MGTYLTGASAALWLAILLLPWRPWSTREVLEADPDITGEDMSDVTALIPARNEAPNIATVLRSANLQGTGLKIVLIDDGSTDGTAQVARACGIEHLTVLVGAPLSPGWTGKLWALEQGRRRVDTRLTLLLDADIALAPGTLAALRAKMDREGLHLVSLMAEPPLESLWEKLLLPAFVYFFKLLYPFRLSNSRNRAVAAAAGGCIFLETRLLDSIGGFAALRDALIDDCALARRAKAHGYRTWLGLTRSARIVRRYRLPDIWEMVARTAFTQLRYSIAWLAVCTAALVTAFWIPVAGLIFPDINEKFLAMVGFLAMAFTYVPVLRFYGLGAHWALTLPLTGTLYLAMTWTSAMRYWAGYRSHWKARTY